MAEKTKPATKTTTAKTTKAKTAKTSAEISSVNLNFVLFSEVLIMILALDYYTKAINSFFWFAIFYLAILFFGELLVKGLKKDLVFGLFTLTAWGICLVFFAVASGIADSSLWNADFMLFLYIIVGVILILIAFFVMMRKNIDFNVIIKNAIPLLLVPLVIAILETRFMLK